MIDKRVIVIIVIFIIGGLFIYSFANPLEDSKDDLSNNGDSSVIVDPSDKDANKIDKSVLERLKRELASLNEEDYTKESWEHIQNQIKQAESANNQKELDKILSEIDLDTLDKYIVEVENPGNNDDPTTLPVIPPNGNHQNSNTGTQKPTVDKTVLNSLRDQISKLNKNDYTADSYQAVINASNLPEATQTQVNNKVTAIQNAINQLKPSKYSVVFDANNGTTNQTVIVKPSQKVSEIANPSKAGYRFLGWYVGDTKFDFNQPITSNLTLMAHWQAKSTVTRFGLAANEPSTIKVLTNGTQIRYKGEMNEKSPWTYNGSTYYNYVKIRISAPEGLSEEEFKNTRLIYQGVTYGNDRFTRDSVTGETYIETLQPFSPNYGSSSINSLTTVKFDIYWGYGSAKTYSITFDIVVYENGTE